MDKEKLLEDYKQYLMEDNSAIYLRLLELITALEFIKEEVNIALEKAHCSLKK